MQSHRDVRAALQRIVRERDETARELLALELERLDALWLAMWAKARGGDVQAGGVLVRVSARRAALCGLDEPVRTELTGAYGGPVIVGPDPEPYASVSDEELLRRVTEIQRALLGSAPDLPVVTTTATTAPAPEDPEVAAYRAALKARGNGQ